MAAYYALLFPLSLTRRGHDRLARRRAWQRLGLLTMLVSALVLAANHDRPLFPTKTVIGWLRQKHPQSQFIERAWRFVSLPTIQSLRGCFDHDVPQSETVIGYASFSGAAEPGLWLPWCKRRVEDLQTGDSPQNVRSRGIAYIVVESQFLEHAGKTLDQWLVEYHAVLVDETDYAKKLGNEIVHLYLVHLLPEPENIKQKANLHENLVRTRGLEPPILSEPDPKSGASAIPPHARCDKIAPPATESQAWFCWPASPPPQPAIAGGDRFV